MYIRWSRSQNQDLELDLEPFYFQGAGARAAAGCVRTLWLGIPPSLGAPGIVTRGVLPGVGLRVL